jgi:hypothetical protein
MGNAKKAGGMVAQNRLKNLQYIMVKQFPRQRAKIIN